MHCHKQKEIVFQFIVCEDAKASHNPEILRGCVAKSSVPSAHCRVDPWKYSEARTSGSRFHSNLSIHRTVIEGKGALLLSVREALSGIVCCVCFLQMRLRATYNGVASTKKCRC
ncbi:hypothetical protein CEXT_13001 [Caerostris extrusa]|uniref:Uncharacterized protein n=1 Tax=Caerostris extrusa TaxID=172846 RepID=A0AAV4VAJ1_CAEEX|nr:hypothetical protein CEXT_13001 [Caerostris extrusa]